METSINPFDAIDKRLESIESKLSVIAMKENSGKPEKLYYSIKEAAEKLQVSEITVYRNVQSGKIPSKRIGSRKLIPTEFIEVLNTQ